MCLEEAEPATTALLEAERLIEDLSLQGLNPPSSDQKKQGELSVDFVHQHDSFSCDVSVDVPKAKK